MLSDPLSLLWLNNSLIPQWDDFKKYPVIPKNKFKIEFVMSKIVKFQNFNNTELQLIIVRESEIFMRNFLKKTFVLNMIRRLGKHVMLTFHTFLLKIPLN